MQRYSLAHPSDQALLRDLAALVARDCTTTTALLAHIAEVDARKLYLPAAYPSMFSYCLGGLRLSEDAAFKRIQAARAARRFPALFEAVAEGRLHLTAVGLLAPYLREDTADDLLAAATHKTKAEIELLPAERFPRPDLLAGAEGIPGSPAAGCGQVPLAPAQVEEDLQAAPERSRVGVQLAPAQVEPHRVPSRVDDRSTVKPLGPLSFAVQFTLTGSAHDRLRYAQDLIGPEIPSGDIAAVCERAIEALIPQLEQRKFDATDRPRRGQRRATASPRHVPAHVKRTVWERDGGQCTFVSEAGRRCEARARLEFDHIQKVARGGEATVSGIRLRCRPHNQFGAECTFGAEFMRHKRLAAAEARAAARAQAAARARAARESAATEQAAAAAERARELDVVPWLRQLGFSASEARQAAAHCDDISDDASLEERVRIALSHFRLRGTRVIREASRNGAVARPLASVGAVPGAGDP